jgi:hypothetical protein
MRNKVKAWLYYIPTLVLFAVILIGGVFAQVSGAYKFQGGNGAFVLFLVLVIAIVACFFAGKYYDSKR